jgi:dienelactone hydrolase
MAVATTSRATRWLSIVVLAAVVTACGGDDDDAAPAVPAAVRQCSDAGDGWRSLDVEDHGDQPGAAVLGDGDVGVVLANDSLNDTCEWMALARELADDGMRAVVFRFGSVQRYDQEVLAAARALRSAGVGRVAAIGASAGGRAVVQAAAHDDQTLAAAISLSAERVVHRTRTQLDPRYPEILPVAQQVHVPSLYVGSEEDGLTQHGRDTRDLHGVTPADVNEILLVPGSDHGVSLLSGAHGPQVHDAIFGLLTSMQ